MTGTGLEGSYDHVIVGAGSAGCVLANRLSADPACRVLLIESGRDTPPDAIPEDIRNSYPLRAYYNPEFQWPDLKARLTGPGRVSKSRTASYEQGRVVGGSSSINGMMAIRGLPSDFQAWVRQGAVGWSWDEVLPHFVAIENDLDFGERDQHGRHGELPIRRVPASEWPGFTHAAKDAFAQLGLGHKPDHNADPCDGSFPMAINNTDHRVSAAEAFLSADVRRRPNLRLLADCTVSRIRIDGARATGVHAIWRGRRLEVSASNVIVCAGALHSPALLMRSGIGPRAVLERAGVDVIIDKPGVGRNLQDHPCVAVASYLRPRARMPRAKGDARHLHLAVRYSSGLERCPAGDMFMLPVNRTAWHSLGFAIGAVLVWVNHSYSQGRVEIASGDESVAPTIDLDLLSDECDLRRLAAGVKMAARAFAVPALAGVCLSEPFGASYSDRVKNLGRVNRRNGAITSVVAAAMDRSRVVRDTMLRKFIAPGSSIAALANDDERLHAWLMDNVTHGWHCTGTCRMGRREDGMAVVDPSCRVIGVAGLRVVDASVMPQIVSANTNLTTLMVASRAAQQIKEQRSVPSPTSFQKEHH